MADNKIDPDSFKPHHHIPKFSVVLFKLIKKPLLIYFTIAGNIIMFLSAYVFFYFENSLNNNVDTYWDALWWALCTVSTVGYGDIVPLTGIGRITGAFLIIFGVMFFLGFMAIMATAMSVIITSQDLPET